MQLRGQLIEFIRRARSSYWFIPGTMALLAIIMSQATIHLDEWMGSKWLDTWDFLYSNKPDGARALLSTIAGSMIGVAGVTFSITIAAVAYASSQFGPRIIDNFMKDRGNQVTLGTFISTFIYCLLILRIVRSGDEGGGFVPHASVFIGVVLAVASLAVLIFFIHHIPESIHISKLVANIGHELVDRVEKVYPEMLGDEEEETLKVGDLLLDKASQYVYCSKDGHLQSLDVETLTGFAGEKSILVDLFVEPGDFLTKGQLLAKVYGDENVTNGVDFEDYFVIGDERSPTQDLFYLSDQLVDIAGRALSPGVNDPQTAMLCINWLNSTLAHLGRRRFPSKYRTTEDGTAVLVAKERDFESFVDSFYDQLRPYLEKDQNAALYAIKRSIQTMESLPPIPRRNLHNAIQRLIEGCLRTFEHNRDLERLSALQHRLAQANSSESQLQTVAEQSTS